MHHFIYYTYIHSYHIYADALRCDFCNAILGASLVGIGISGVLNPLFQGPDHRGDVVTFLLPKCLRGGGEECLRGVLTWVPILLRGASLSVG